jgi:phosphoenolpyruvate synthase/pyruvate phosphate dikinase
LLAQANGGTKEGAPKDTRSANVTDEQAIAVADLAAKVEVHYGQPMDIEWAIEDGALFLLQSTTSALFWCAHRRFYQIHAPN